MFHFRLSSFLRAAQEDTAEVAQRCIRQKGGGEGGKEDDRVARKERILRGGVVGRCIYSVRVLAYSMVSKLQGRIAGPQLLKATYIPMYIVIWLCV